MVLQTVPVTLGVILGVLVSNWGENRKSNEQAEIFIETVKKEVNQNQSKVEASIGYHRMIRDSCLYYLSIDSLPKNPTFFRGTQIPSLNTSAYETGKQTGLINELDLETIQSLNKLYTYQEEHNAFSSQVTQGLLTMDFDESKQSMNKIGSYISISMSDIVIQEENLISGFNQIQELMARER